MVGVPGRSKGCGTCRHRKIKCDTQRPACGNCIRTGRACQGYERYPVFVNRTADGLQKRHHLEEVKGALNPFECSSDERESHSASGFPVTVLVELRSFGEEDLLYWLHGSFAATHIAKNAPSLLVPIIPLAQTDSLVRSSLLALSSTRFGQMMKSQSAIKIGQKHYIDSLCRLRVAVNDPIACKTETTLACAIVLGLFELFNSKPICEEASWRKHMTGIECLLKHRGPWLCQTPLSLAILEQSRRVLMTKALVERRLSVFSQHEWLEVPWNGKRKSSLQRFCDFGLQLGALTGRYDTILTAEVSNIDDLQDLLVDSTNLYRYIEDEHHDCFCTNVSENMISRPQENNWFSESTIMDRASCATSAAIRLSCCTVNAVLHKKLKEHHSESALSNNKTQSFSNTTQSPSALPHSEAQRHSLAQDVVRLAKLCETDKLDPGAVMRLVWSLKLAAGQLNTFEPTSVECSSLIDRLRNTKPWS